MRVQIKRFLNKTDCVPFLSLPCCLFRYDLQLLLQALATWQEHCLAEDEVRVDGDVSLEKVNKKLQRLIVIPKNTERFVSLQIGGVLFLDSIAFLKSSLEKLAANLSPEDFVVTRSVFGENFNLMTKKGFFPYEYLTDFNKLEETGLPPKDKFYSSLREEGISDEDYAHAQHVFKKMECRTLGDYLALYNSQDTLLLCDIFETFRASMHKQYGLDPAWSYTLPSYSWDCCLYKTRRTLHLFNSQEANMYLFCEDMVRGGLCTVFRKITRANHPGLGSLYDPKKPLSYIHYLDANGLYPHSMCLFRYPVDNFRWLTEEEMVQVEQKLRNGELSEESETGYFINCDLTIPDSLHDLFSDFPLAPEKVKVPDEWLSCSQNSVLNKLKRHHVGGRKLVATLYPKKNYKLHYLLLQYFIQLGIKLDKIHQVLAFRQEQWMADYILPNVELRKRATNASDKACSKLMSNA
jgi:hypothetical protein